MNTNFIALGPNTSELINDSYTANKKATINSLSFFLIGSNKSLIDLFSRYFKSGTSAESFDNAIKQLFQASVEGNVPDVIFIDMPLEKQKLNALSFLLKSNPLLSNIPVIYNGRYLDTQLVYELITRNLIDEATEINYWNRNFEAKIILLKKVKKRQENIFRTISSSTKTYRRQLLNSFFKRMFDIAVSLVLLVVLLPVFILIAIAIRIESRGPIFYNSLRAGAGCKIFKFFKFRTMEVDADKKINQIMHLNQYKETGDPEPAMFLKVCNDPRVTGIGKFLRNTSIDELPQLVNVLIGDMSLVGNRPLPIYEAATLTGEEAVERFMAPAGITGLWQVEKRSNLKMSVDERIGLDIKYARHHNFIFDMLILAKTPKAMIQKANV